MVRDARNRSVAWGRGEDVHTVGRRTCYNAQRIHGPEKLQSFVNVKKLLSENAAAFSSTRLSSN